MPFTFPGKSLFWRPSTEGTQRKQYGQMTDQMKSFELPSQFAFDPNTMLNPFYGQARGDVGGAYSGAISGLTGSDAWQRMLGASDLNRGAFQFALGQQRQGSGLMNEELARIAKLSSEGGGWDLSNPAAMAEIAPEVNAAGASLDEAIRAAEASGVRGGALAAMKYGASRDAGTAMGNALQEAIRNARAQKMAIAQAKFGAQNLTMQDPQSAAMMSTLAGLYGNQAGALSGLGSDYMRMGVGGMLGNLDRSSDLFKYLQQLSWGGGQAAADRASKESQFGVSAGPGGVNVSGYSDERLKTPPDKVKGALSDLKTLPVYDYQYNELADELGYEPAGKPGRGVMAQDLEKIPAMRHLVSKDPAGFRKVDVYGLTATALAAVKELDRKLDRIARMKAPKGISHMRLAHA